MLHRKRSNEDLVAARCPSLAPGQQWARRAGRSLSSGFHVAEEPKRGNHTTGGNINLNLVGFFKHNFFFKPVFTFIPENMRAWVYENRERERQREREGWRFTGRGGPSASNSFRAPRVLRAWERGELFFPAKKEQGSNNTVLQQKPRALQRQGLRPPGQGRDSTHRVYLEVRVSASVIPIKYTSGKLNVTVVIAQAAWRQANKCLDSRRLEKKRSYYYRIKLHHCQHSGLVQQHLIVDLFRNC